MKSIIIRFIILVAILSIPTYLIYEDYSSSLKSTVVLPGGEFVDIATTTLNIPSKSDPTPTPTVKVPSVNVVPLENMGSKSVSTLPKPNLDKPWVLPTDYSAEVKRIMNFKIEERTKDLKDNPEQFDKWIDLGILRKTVGDYEEAKNIWEYTASGWPESIVSYHNLGDIYANYLKDNARAEKNMLKVVELDPHYVPEYLSLYGLYKKIHGETGEKTGAVLLRGVDTNPTSVDLLITTAIHYKEINDKENAKKYYNLALDEAEKLKNESLVKSIQLELSKI